MIINSKFKIYPSIFIHIPKCGGSSIKIMLSDINDKKNIHSKLQNDFDKIKENNSDFKKYFIFSMIRNPWDRMVSYYFFYKHTIKTNEEISLNAKKYDFNDWLEIIYENKNDYYFVHENYLDYLTIDGIVCVDYLMNFYYFEDECNNLKKILKINCENLHVNKTEHKYYKEYYSDKLIELVNNIYRKDIEYFNFDFNNEAQMKEIKNNDKLKVVSSKKLYI